MNKYTCLIVLCFCVGFSYAQEWNQPLAAFKDFPEGAIYQNKGLDPEVRTKNAVDQLTFQEVLSMVGGWNKFFVPGLPRLGLRPVFMANASQGVNLRKAFTDEDTSTSFPGALALAATWNVDLAHKMGVGIGRECRICGVDILLGPGLNMQRFSVSGRNYEYYGEDPVLTATMGTAFIKGLQSNNVLATAKHFLGNDQEFCRHITSSNIDERTMREIYLPPWESAIRDADVKAIMTGNNLVNGVPNAIDDILLNGVLREEYGFTGITMTDWQNTNYFPELQNMFPKSGMSLLMPDSETFMSYLEPYLTGHPEKQAMIDSLLRIKVYQNLLPLFEMGIYDRPEKDKSLVPEMEKHKTLARMIAEEAFCLLKNDDDFLPIIDTAKHILLIGPPELHSGKGSGFVKGYDHTTYADGLESYFPNFVWTDSPSEDDVISADAVIYILNKEAGEGLDVPFAVGRDHRISWTAALNPNVVVVINSSNGLPMPWVNEVKSVLWANFLGQERGNALVNIINGNSNPSGKLPFTLEHRFEDSQDPDFNYVNGKPYWYGNNNFYKSYWMGYDSLGANEHFRSNINPHQTIPVDYSEGVFIGYRWYDKQKKDVLFPFGHGISYTTFDYGEMKLSSKRIKENGTVAVTVDLTNSGERSGAEVVQLYVSDKDSSVERPLRELKHFKKIFLNPGETISVTFYLRFNDLAFWDVNTHDWKVEPGDFLIELGSSSRDVREVKELAFK
ncbi:MAG: glycoside hydrolase family 3 N-terminal domain-containing protein [Cyclobacteriaceae bacterium]